MAMTARVALLCMGLTLAACGSGENSLSGSIGRTHPLGFDVVQVRQVSNSYTIAYLKDVQTVARLAYTPEAAIAPGVTLVLRFTDPTNAGLSRATTDGLRFPSPKDGTIIFDIDPTGTMEGVQVSGRFGLLFDSGDTLSGSFAGALTRANP